MAGFCEYGDDLSDPIHGAKFDSLSAYYLLKKGCATQN
jgi:hypothetical protein